MTVLLGALVLVGRILLVLVLVVLAAVILLLLAPVGLAVRWTPAAGITVGAYAGPLRRTLFPWHHRKKKKPEKRAKTVPAEPAGKTPAAPDTSSGPAEKTQPASAAASSLPPAHTSPAEKPSGGAEEAEPPLPPVEPQPEELTSGEQDALLGAARIFFGTLTPHRARLLRGVQVNKLQVFWTVTGEDAADTAVAYGRRIALSNNLLALARQYLTIRAESLRLEPDFTGTLAGKRIFSCQIRIRPYIILLILFYLMRRDEKGHIPLEEIQDKLGALT